MKSITSKSVVTEKTVRDDLLRHFPPHESLIAFNLCGIGPYDHEMDVVRVLDSGWAYEFEIKVTAADIRADGRKLRKYSDLSEGCQKSVYSARYGEHDWTPEQLIAKAQPVEGMIGDFFMNASQNRRGLSWPEVCARIQRPIKQFCCVVPTAELAEVAVKHLPEWAGVAVCQHTRWLDVRKAKTLPHARKLTDAERAYVLKRMYSRFWLMYFERGGTGRK